MMNAGRRDAVAAIGATLLAPAAMAAHARATSWPERFVWGVATAAHQIEGNNVNSDYWLLEHLPGTYFKEPSGDACDSWHRWREDIDLVHALGLTTYRFSIEWARIEPEPGHYSSAVLTQYRRMCMRCRELGIMPIITLHHFSSPRWVAGMGGWENPLVGQAFARYCETAMRALGDLVGAVCTMNEPNAQVTSYIMGGAKSSALELALTEKARQKLGSTRFGAYFMGDARKVRDGCLAAHGLAVNAIKNVRPDLKVGLTLALQDLSPGPDGATLYRQVFEEARRPFYEAASKDDFIGVQTYMRMVVGTKGYLPAPAGVLLNRYGADASPDALAGVVREVHRHCRAPILVSEHGIDTTDDTQRVAHLDASLAELAKCIADGVPVLGYIHWTLMDNFEWSAGYVPRFGLYSVDRKTFARTPKPSAARLRALVAAANPARGIDRL